MIPAHLQNRTLEQLRSTQETIRCFLVVPTGEGYESLIITEDGQCIENFKYHRSEVVVRRFALGENDVYPEGWISDDERKVKAVKYCTRCGNHNFSEAALNRIGGSKGRGWERLDTGQRADNLNDFGPGAMWFVSWYKNDETGLYTHPGFGKGFSESPLSVRTPGGDWLVDARCSNCSLPEDDTHKCWPRTGIAPEITVDKNLGHTCNVGGGSVIQGDYHGFLRGGFLVRC